MSTLILFCLEAVLLSSIIPVYKWGMKRTEVFCSSFINMSGLFVALFISLLVQGKFGFFETVKNEDLLNILLCGTLLAVFALFLLLSLKYGLMYICIAIYSMAFFYLLIFKRIIENRGIDLTFFLGCIFYICGIICILIKNKNDKRSIKKNGVLYAIAATVAFCLLCSVDMSFFEGSIQDSEIKSFLIISVAMCVLFLFCILFQKLKDFKKCFKKDSLPKLLVPTALLITAVLLYRITGRDTTYNVIYCICLPVSALFSCVLQKEKYSMRSIIGILLSTAGLFVMSFFK